MTTAFKHNLTNLMDSPWNMISGVNVASDYVLAYVIIGLTFTLSAYLMIRKTNDIGKSMVSSSYIVFILSLILFYGGKAAGTDFIPDIAMLFLSFLLAIVVAGIKFMRFNKNENS